MSLPAGLPHEITARAGLGTVRAVTPLGGGCIHHAVRIDADGGPVFCKWNRGAAGEAFGAEARGLEALAAAAGDDLSVPAVLSWQDASRGSPGWLVLEYLPPSDPAPDHDERLGRGLAGLHRPRPGAWGWEEDNWIGSLPQANPPSATWADFWCEARLEPQIRRAGRAGLLDRGDRALMDAAVTAAPGLLADVESDGPSLVHGDLWAGNVHAGPDGRPVLIDPAVHRGHREVDLAMAALFGGLSDRALAAYGEVAPLRPGAGLRRPLYQLYYLLVHLNLFGSGYLGACRRSAGAVIGPG